MTRQIAIRPQSLSKVEIICIIGLLIMCLILAVLGKGRRERKAYRDFLRRAPIIQQAMEKYALDNQGRFPVDAMFTGPPPGFTSKYLVWDSKWNIDYDVHPNGKGGFYVALEYCGPRKESSRYSGLGNNAFYREKYGKGQPIPGEINRLWVIRENAKIDKKPPTPPPRGFSLGR